MSLTLSYVASPAYCLDLISGKTLPHPFDSLLQASDSKETRAQGKTQCNSAVPFLQEDMLRFPFTLKGKWRKSIQLSHFHVLLTSRLKEQTGASCSARGRCDRAHPATARSRDTTAFVQKGLRAEPGAFTATTVNVCFLCRPGTPGTAGQGSQRLVAGEDGSTAPFFPAHSPARQLTSGRCLSWALAPPPELATFCNGLGKNKETKEKRRALSSTSAAPQPPETG